MEDYIDITKLRYVLYARKSSTDETRQVRSIPDQIADCNSYIVDRLGINVIETLQETKSAKKPGIRPKFRQMLKDIKDNKYDAIVAWHPDRLARNMLEGGEIIDMVDQGIIKDLKFVTQQFSKDANGKMLLGMSFVLSKQYSDKLSQDVTRGQRRSFSEGKSHVPKFGYISDENGLYKPDDKNFYLISQAWTMRSKGLSVNQINNYLNSNGLIKLTKKGRKIKITIQKLSRMFKDPFNYGILIHGKTGQKIDLRLVYDFEPVTTEEMYNKVQQLSYRRIKPNSPHKIAFYPLKLMIKCSFCGGNMYVGPSKNKYLYARCDNDPCSRGKKSIRMMNIFSFIYDFLEKGLNFTEDEYNYYLKKTKGLSENKKERLLAEIHSKQSVLRSVGSELKSVALGITKLEQNSIAWRINESKIQELSSQKQELENSIKKIKDKVNISSEDHLTLEEFLNLSKNAATIVKSANAVIKDQICRLIFLNLTVDEEKVLSYQLKEPFLTLFKRRRLSSSRSGGT